MSTRRQLVVLALGLAPVLALVVAGAWALVESGRLLWLGWIFPLCWGAAWLVSRGQREERLEPPPRLADRRPSYWTPRDREAAELVDERIRRVPELPTERLVDPELYLEAAVELANELARVYHPRAKRPIARARLVEVVAALNLAFEDLEQRVEEYVPGSHLLTIDQWRMIARSPEWFEVATRVGQVVSTVLQPLNLGRFLLAEGAAAPVKKRIKQNVLVALHAFFLRELGFYLIEMNSGRLASGSKRYRELLRGGGRPDGAEHVTVALVGQSGAGKSSVVNCLLGERRAQVDVLPSTREVARHRLRVEGAASELELLDTPGYGTGEEGERRLRETIDSWRSADLVLLVMDVQNQDRGADLALLERATAELEDAAHEKPPPVLGVLTHVDRLSPVLEWSPPYDWERPVKAKEHSLRGAVDYLRERFGERLAGVVPVCADFESGRAHGVQEELLPAMTALLDEASARSLLRALHAELDQTRVERVFRQLRNVGRSLIRASS